MLMTSDQDPDAVANLSGKGIHGVYCGCYRGMWWLHGTCFANPKPTLSVKDLILLLFTMTENNGFFHQYCGFCPNDAELNINFRLYLFRAVLPAMQELNDPVEKTEELRKRKRNTPTPAWGFSTSGLSVLKEL